MNNLILRQLKSILLVDDDSISNFITQNLIEKIGLAETIHSLKNGQEALNYLLSNHADIILLDLHMPVMDGFDFLKELSIQMPDYFKSVKIYILTSSANPSDIDRIKKFDIEGYITKPLSSEKIAKISLLNSRIQVCIMLLAGYFIDASVCKIMGETSSVS